MNVLTASLYLLGAVSLPPASADCVTTWNDGTPPDGCDIVLSAAATCPAACQSYFEQVLSDCISGTVLSEIGGFQVVYKEYTLWGEFYGMYPKCNLGYNATRCDDSLIALEGEVFGKCSKQQNSPCSDDCSALIDAVNTDCAEGPATYVPTCCELDKTYTEQTYRQETLSSHFSSITYDQSCVDLLQAPASGGGGADDAASASSSPRLAPGSWAPAPLLLGVALLSVVPL
jgi:hypothetical protein